MLETLPAYEGDDSCGNILAWLWTYQSEKRIIAVNYADRVSTCRLRLDFSDYGEQMELKDMLNNHSYLRSVEEMNIFGLYIELRNYQSHIFSVRRRSDAV